MAENTNTPNTQDGFAMLAETLAGMGHTLEARTRLTFGKDVASKLAGIVTGGFVAILCEGATDKDVATYNGMVTAATLDKVAVIDARTHGYGKVRPNVNTFLKSRKLKAVCTPPRKDDDGTPIVFLVRKTA
jgi:hypothetical protein